MLFLPNLFHELQNQLYNNYVDNVTTLVSRCHADLMQLQRFGVPKATWSIKLFSKDTCLVHAAFQSHKTKQKDSKGLNPVNGSWQIDLLHYLRVTTSSFVLLSVQGVQGSVSIAIDLILSMLSMWYLHCKFLVATKRLHAVCSVDCRLYYWTPGPPMQFLLKILH